MKRIITLLIIIDILLNVVVILKLNEKKDIGYHEIADCIEINEDIFCKISPAADY